MTKKFKVIIAGQKQEIDFTCMGLDSIASDFLNWCMNNRNNLEFIKENKTLEVQASTALLYFDDLKVIQRVDKTSVDKRGGG